LRDYLNLITWQIIIVRGEKKNNQISFASNHTNLLTILGNCNTLKSESCTDEAIAIFVWIQLWSSIGVPSLVYHSNTGAWFSSKILYCSWFWPLNVMSSHCLNNKAHMIEFSSCPFLLNLLGPAPTRAMTIAFDPTFGSFTLLELVSHYGNWFLWWKCLDCLNWNRRLLVFRVWT
jgi:hypothetical protein